MHKLKSVLIGFLFALITTSTFSQDINAQFETWPPAGWANFVRNSSLDPWESNPFGYNNTDGARSAIGTEFAEPGSEKWLVSPLVKPTTSKHTLSFWESIGSTSATYTSSLTIRVSFASQTTASDFSTVTTYSSTTLTTGVTNRTIDLSAYNDIPIYIAFVIAENNAGDYQTSWEVDNVTGIDLSTPSVDDAQVTSLTQATTCSLTASETFTATIYNRGTDAITSCPVEYRINGGSWTSAGTYAGNITNGNSDTHDFILDLSAYTSCTIEVRTQLVDDEVSGNDATSIEVGSNVVESGTSYSNSFEGSDGDEWVIFDIDGNADAGEGEWTISSGEACDGTNHFIYEDDPNAAANDWIISPCIYLTSGDRYEINFQYKIGAFGPEKLLVAIGDDQTPSDMTLQTWDLGSISNTTCTEFSQEYIASYTGIHYVGIKAYSDAFEDIIVIDDFNIIYLPSDDAAATNLTTSESSSCDVGSSVSFTATIYNDGLNTITSCPIEYQVNGSGWESAGTYTGSITAGNSDNFDFDIDLSVENAYTVEVRTQLIGDEDASDDIYSGSVSITHQAPVNLYLGDLTNGFEVAHDQTGWNTLDVNADGNATSGAGLWKIGTTSVCVGNQNIEYKAMGSTANDWVFSPCVDMVEGETYRVTLKRRTTGTTAGFPTFGNGFTEKLSIAVLSSQDPADVVSVVYDATGLTSTACTDISADYVATTTGSYNYGFKVYSAANQGSLRLDDITIAIVPPAEANNASAIDVIVPNYDCGLGASEDVTVTIENFGSNTITSCPIEYRIDGGSWTSAGTYSGSIAFGMTDEFTFSLDLSANAGSTLDVRTQLASDGDGSNDALTGYTILDYIAHDFETDGDFTMNFEGGDDFNNWNIIDVNDDGDGEFGQWSYQTDGYDCSGTGYAVYTYSDQTANDWLITPCIYYLAGYTYTLTFNYKSDDPGLGTYTEKMLVGLGSSSSAGAMTTTLEDIGAFSGGFGCTGGEIDFTVPSDGIYYIGFKAYSDADEFYLVLDDVNIEKQATPDTYYAVASGNMSDAIWSETRGGGAQTISPTNATTLIIQDSYTVTLNQNISIDNLTIESGGTLTSDNLNRTITLKGDWTNDGYFDGDNTTVTFNGIVQQNIIGGTRFDNLTLNNISGINLTSGEDSIAGLLSVNAGTLTTNGNLRILSEASKTGAIGNLNTGIISGDVTVERYIPAGATNYRMLSSPIQNGTIESWDDDFITSGFPGSDYPNFPSSSNRFKSITYYDETAAGAQNIGFEAPANSSDALTPGLGYWVWCGDNLGGTNAFDITVTGTINSGDIYLPVDYTDTGNPANDGWNLVGNPYPSDIDWTGVLAGNLSQKYYVYDPQSGNMDLWNEIDESNLYNLNGNIASGHGFWVKATDGTDILVQENDKASNAVALFENEFKAAVATLTIDVNSTLNLFYDRVRLKWNENAEYGTDDYDAIKFNGGNYYAPKMALMVNDLLWSINAMPAPTDTLSIPIRVWANLSGTYTVDFNPEQLFTNTTCMEVFKKSTGETFVVSDDLTIPISVQAGVNNEDLVLKVAGTVLYTSENVSCYNVNNGHAAILAPTDDTWTVDWKDFDGNTLKTESISGNPSTINNLAPGNYMAFLSNPTCGEKSAPFEITEPEALNVNASKSDETCYGVKDGSIAINAFGGTGEYRYYLNNTITQSEINNLAPGTYAVKVKDENNCTSQVINTTIAGGQEIIFAVDQSTNSVNLNANEPVTFEYLGAPADRVYWDFGDGGIGTGNFVSHLFGEVGIFEIICTVDIDDCSATHSPLLVEVTDAITSINSTATTDNTLTAHYNNDKLFIQFKDNLTINELSITNVQGQQIFTANNLGSNNHLTVNVPTLSPGTYLLKTTSNLKQTITKFIVTD